MNPNEKRRDCVPYSADGENEVSKRFIISLGSGRERNIYIYMYINNSILTNHFKLSWPYREIPQNRAR